jgi:hypothetical protein
MYGDCKALTNFMKSLLDYAGIESYYTTVQSGRQPGEILREIPSQQFNHAVLTVPLGNDTLWLENTSNSNPFGYAGTSIRNRTALLVDHGRSRLIRIPALREDEVRESRRIEYMLDIAGNAEALYVQRQRLRYEIYNAC